MDVFVSQFNSNLSSLFSSTFVGEGMASGIALDSSENVYITGGTYTSAIYPTTVGSYHPTTIAGPDVFVSKFSSNLPPCSPPISGDWALSSSCTMSSSAIAPANVIVNNGAVLTIPNGVTLTIPFTSNHLLIHSGGGVLVKSGGKLD